MPDPSEIGAKLLARKTVAAFREPPKTTLDEQLAIYQQRDTAAQKRKAEIFAAATARGDWFPNWQETREVFGINVQGTGDAARIIALHATAETREGVAVEVGTTVAAFGVKSAALGVRRAFIVAAIGEAAFRLLRRPIYSLSEFEQIANARNMDEPPATPPEVGIDPEFPDP